MRKIWLLMLLSFFFLSCGEQKRIYWNLPVTKSNCKYTYKVNGRTYCVRKKADGYVEYGIASWYGPGFHGRRTASGEIYNMYKLTAAHKTLPLGTYVKVINLENGRSVIVKINDRGPFVRGRIIDLSYAAAKKIKMLKKGTAKVKIIALGKRVDHKYIPVETTKGRFYIQVGAFRNKLNAYKFKNKIYKKFGIKAKVVKLDNYYRVLAGPTYTYKKAKEFKRKLRNIGIKDSFIIRY
nr:septal ring lytic transglycosylase RlpA family protein [Desulfurobacterium thermolithotrophum]